MAQGYGPAAFSKTPVDDTLGRLTSEEFQGTNLSYIQSELFLGGGGANFQKFSMFFFLKTLYFFFWLALTYSRNF